VDIYIDVKIVERESLRVLSTRGMAATERFEDRYVQLYRKAFQKRLKVEGAPVAIFHNEHFDGQLPDMEAALPVTGADEDIREIPGGTFAVTAHQGPHGTLPVTMALMGAWLEKNGHSVCGAPWCVYVRGGNDKIIQADQYITEIYFPIAKEEALLEFDFGENFGKSAADLIGE
jgi:effector-binding domain-containing protein